MTAAAIALAGKVQRFGLGHAPNRECSRKVESERASLHDLCGTKRNVRVLIGVEKIFALQLVILHPASRVHARRLDLDIQDTVFDMIGGKRQ